MSTRRTLVLLGAVISSSSTAFTVGLTLVPLLAVKLGASAGVVGILTASLSLLPMLLAIRMGGLVDRIGARGGLVIAAALLALAPASVLVHRSVVALFATEVLLGLGNLFTVVSGQTYTATIGGAKDRDRHFGWYTTFVGIGQIVGPLMAGLLADRYGFLTALGSATAVAALGLTAVLLLPSISARAAEGSTVNGRGGTLRRAASLASIASVQFALVFTFANSLAQSVFLSFFPVILQAAGISAGVIGALIALRALVATALRPFLPTITRLTGNRERALVTTVLVMAFSALAIALNQSTLTAAIVSVSAGLAWGLAPPLAIIMVVAGTSASEVGLALGVRFTANRLAQLVGPLIIGAIADLASVKVGFGASAVLIASSIGYMRRYASLRGRQSS